MAEIKKKLILQREVLRDLSEADLRNVVGGVQDRAVAAANLGVVAAHPPTHFWFTQ